MKRYEAKTREAVLALAAQDKNVKEEDLIYYIIEEKTGGFLGIGNKVIIEAFVMEEVGTFIHDYLSRFFDNIGLKTEVTVKQIDNHSFNVNISSENNAILIGKAGQTMQSLATVVKAATNAEFKRKINVSIDINGYKESRFEKLEQMVNDLWDAWGKQYG